MPGTQVATVGRIRAEPGAPNVIPGRVEMSLEIRDLAADKMESVFRAVEAEAKGIAGARGTPITFSEIDVAPRPRQPTSGCARSSRRRPPRSGCRTGACRAAPGTTRRTWRTSRRWP